MQALGVDARGVLTVGGLDWRFELQRGRLQHVLHRPVGRHLAHAEARRLLLRHDLPPARVATTPLRSTATHGPIRATRRAGPACGGDESASRGRPVSRDPGQRSHDGRPAADVPVAQGYEDSYYNLAGSPAFTAQASRQADRAGYRLLGILPAVAGKYLDVLLYADDFAGPERHADVHADVPPLLQAPLPRDLRGIRRHAPHVKIFFH